MELIVNGRRCAVSNPDEPLLCYLRDELELDGMVQETNFDTYSIMRMAQTPSISVELLESGDVPFGMGEPVIGPVAPSVANAVFAAAKLRLRELPLRLSA